MSTVKDIKGITSSFILSTYCQYNSIIIPDEYLLTLDSTRDKYSIVQCNQKGVENCKPVTVNAELFKSLIDRKGSSVKLMEGSDIQLKVYEWEYDGKWSSLVLHAFRYKLSHPMNEVLAG